MTRHSVNVYFDSYAGKWIAEPDDFPDLQVKADNLQDLIKMTRIVLAAKLGLIDVETVRADMGLIN